MAVEDVKWYRCIAVPEKKQEGVNENEMNAFISYTFGANRTRNLRYYAPRDPKYDWEADYDWISDRYDFKLDCIYKVVGKYIIDDSGVSHELASIADCFTEYNLVLDDEVKALIKRKEDKGDKIQIKPLFVETRGTMYEVTCAVARRHTYMITSRKNINAYEGIIRCYKTLRDSCPNIPRKIKYILEDRIRKTKK